MPGKKKDSIKRTRVVGVANNLGKDNWLNSRHIELQVRNWFVIRISR
jgi:hypothetical protein